MLGFKTGLKTYLNVNHKLHNALIINGKDYPVYEGYMIHAGIRDTKLAQNLQHKTTITMKKAKLKLRKLRVAVNILDIMIRYTKK